jgi:DNA-binding response OmpR family regulator
VASARRILYVDSDAEARLLMQDLLAPHELDVVATEADARAIVRRHAYDLYVISGGSPASSGLELCAWLHRIDPRTPIVFCSSNGTARFQQAVIAAGAVRYLVKPLDPSLLRSTLGLLLKLAELESRRAMAAEQQAIHDSLVDQAQRAKLASAQAREKADAARSSMLRAKAYRAFREAGGNRANFERMWETALAQANGTER